MICNASYFIIITVNCDTALFFKNLKKKKRVTSITFIILMLVSHVIDVLLPVNKVYSGLFHVSTRPFLFLLFYFRNNAPDKRGIKKGRFQWYLFKFLSGALFLCLCFTLFIFYIKLSYYLIALLLFMW
uniref:Uncharacterized protein n=1 Tax=Microbotryum lychnidis-dioicae TaxID=288795 RepID=M1GMG0_9BASI|nr:hypothetical protein H911_mgp04 [Microbotryum lychnidis-dioicae]AGE14614.1 hypothetical protein [Microbotryum lychnidis-dioicae]